MPTKRFSHLFVISKQNFRKTKTFPNRWETLARELHVLYIFIFIMSHLSIVTISRNNISIRMYSTRNYILRNRLRGLHFTGTSIRQLLPGQRQLGWSLAGNIGDCAITEKLLVLYFFGHPSFQPLFLWLTFLRFPSVWFDYFTMCSSIFEYLAITDCWISICYESLTVGFVNTRSVVSLSVLALRDGSSAIIISNDCERFW